MSNNKKIKEVKFNENDEDILNAIGEVLENGAWFLAGDDEGNIITNYESISHNSELVDALYTHGLSLGLFLGAMAGTVPSNILMAAILAGFSEGLISNAMDQSEDGVTIANGLDLFLAPIAAILAEELNEPSDETFEKSVNFVMEKVLGAEPLSKEFFEDVGMEEMEESDPLPFEKNKKFH